ncbi:MAG: class I SAM-dependent methyltransferase [Nitrososphaeraceae archaeon]
MQFEKGIFLDLGSGRGTQAVQLAKKRFNLIGSDISKTVIKTNKIIYENKYLDLQFVVDNILHPNFKDNYFDYI